MGLYSTWSRFSSLKEKPSFQPWHPSDRWNTWYNLPLLCIWLKTKWLLPRINNFQQLPDSLVVFQHISPSCSCCYSMLSSGCCTLKNTEIKCLWISVTAIAPLRNTIATELEITACFITAPLSLTADQWYPSQAANTDEPLIDSMLLLLPHHWLNLVSPAVLSLREYKQDFFLGHFGVALEILPVAISAITANLYSTNSWFREESEDLCNLLQTLTIQTYHI